MIDYPALIAKKQAEKARLKKVFSESDKSVKDHRFYNTAIREIDKEIKHYESKLTQK